MSEKKVFHPIRGLFILLKNLFFIACVLLAGFGVVGYAAGWVKFAHDPQQDKATVDIETGEVKHAVENAVEKTKVLAEQAGDTIESMTQDEGVASPDNETSVPDKAGSP